MFTLKTSIWLYMCVICKTSVEWLRFSVHSFVTVVTVSQWRSYYHHSLLCLLSQFCPWLFLNCVFLYFCHFFPCPQVTCLFSQHLPALKHTHTLLAAFTHRDCSAHAHPHTHKFPVSVSCISSCWCFPQLDYLNKTRPETGDAWNSSSGLFSDQWKAEKKQLSNRFCH